MALNIPVNLMSTVAPHSQTQIIPASEGGGVRAIAPTAAGETARNSTADGGPGSGKDGSEQQMLMSKLRTTLTKAAKPDSADASSILLAQTAPPTEQSVPKASQKMLAEPEPHASELDRYAPPDPLPTGPILRAASAYAAQRDRE